MAYHISDDCISCGACEAECPVGAISEGDGKFEINADLCTECGSSQMLALLELPSSNQSLHQKSLHGLRCAGFLLCRQKILRMIYLIRRIVCFIWLLLSRFSA